MKKILLLVISILLISGCGVKEFKKQTEEDRIKFKTDIEALNDELDDNGLPVYKQLSIDEDNRIVYLTYDELVKFIDSGSGVLYFGRPGCPWCRLLIPYLLEFASDNDTYIYYYDIEADRTENNAKYKKILELLDEFLPVDTVTQSEDDEDFDKDLKRIVLPQLFFIKKGEVKDDTMLYEHEYLKNEEKEKTIDLLNSKYKSIK